MGARMFAALAAAQLLLTTAVCAALPRAPCVSADLVATTLSTPEMVSLPGYSPKPGRAELAQRTIHRPARFARVVTAPSAAEVRTEGCSFEPRTPAFHVKRPPRSTDDRSPFH